MSLSHRHSLIISKLVSEGRARFLFFSIQDDPKTAILKGVGQEIPQNSEDRRNLMHETRLVQRSEPSSNPNYRRAIHE